MRKWFAALAAVTVAVVTMAVMTPASPASAADQDAAFAITKTVVGGQTTFEPGDTFQYRITVACSSTTTGGCVNANITDELPAPLILNPDANPQVTATLAPAGPVNVSYSGSSGFTVTPNETWLFNGTSETGMVAGHQLTITVSAKVPDDVPGTDNGEKFTNTATANADNAPSKNASADVTLSVPTTLDAGITKNASVSTIPAVPGQPVDWTLVPTNDSNQTVDTIVVQDPIDVNNPPTNLQYLDISGGEATPPETTTSVDVEYYIDGAWTSTPPPPPIKADGFRVTFHGSYAPGASGNVVVHSTTNDQVTSIPDGTSQTIHNSASTIVEKNGESSDPATDTAEVTISANAPDVSITKSFDDNTLLSGQSTTADVKATVGSQNVESMTVNEPSSGQPGLAEQGLTFDGFGSVTWPVAATQATITYDYTDCASSTATTTTVNTLPDPTADCTVDGFSVTYESPGTNGIQSGSYADIPMNVTANRVVVRKASTNVVDTSVTNTQGQTGDANTKAGFTISPLTVDTNVTKKMTPAAIFGEPGTSATVSLTGKVSDDSTVGSDSLIISDPNNPGTDTTGFWDQFTADNVQTDVPNCSVLTVNYWSVSQGAYVPLPGASNIKGPQQNVTITVPSDVQSDIGGIQFVFLPDTAAGCPSTLPPGFNVTPTIGVETTQTNDTPITVDNGVCSRVANPDAVRSPQTDCADASIDINPIDGGEGNGPQFVNKAWTDDTVPALSADQRTTRIGWSTQGLKLTSMAITDPATQGELDNVAGSVFDAWNLTRIQPITTADDPLIAQDVITEVSLYENGAWTDITAAACANGCTGQFGGYTLSAAEQSDATGVRFVYSERTAGAGIGSSYGFDRPLNLTWTLRDTLRSNPGQYVLGTEHTYTYNTGDPGVVNNTVQGTGTTEGDVSYDSTANDEITIVDSPVNVGLTKSFDQTDLGLPQDGTAQADYPLISSSIVGTNNTAGRISSMVITDPAASQAAPTVFDTLNLYSIDTITPPPGATAADTIVTLTGGPNAGSYDLAAAEALTPADLATVTGIEVSFGSPTGPPIIDAAAQGTVGLTWQLRATYRTSGDPMQPTNGNAVENDAHVQIDSPDRIPCTDDPDQFCSSGQGDANAEFNILQGDYTVTTSKSISPATMYENVTPPNYTSTLVSQPDGNARTILMTTTDDTPTFWNTMDYTSASITLPAPVNQARMDVLVDDPDPGAGKTITWNVVAGRLIASCNGTPVTQSSPCWTLGEWVPSSSGSTVNFTLPDGVTASQVVGVRFEAREIVDGAPVQWERPYNPKLTYSLNTTRREFTRSDPALLVGTDRPDLQPNPGETQLGVITNTVDTHGDAQFGPGQSFTDDESATDTTLVQHLVNSISVTKTRGSAGLLDANSPIPYLFTVANTGQWDMTGLTITDQITPLVNGVSPVIEPTPPGYAFRYVGPNGETGDTTGFAAHLDEDTGIITVTTPADFVFLHGWRLTVSAPLLFRPGLDPNTVIHNSVTASSDRDFETCASTTTNLTPKPDTHDVSDCTADTTVAPAASSVISLKKWVKGDGAGVPSDASQDDLGVLNVPGTGADKCSPSYDDDNNPNTPSSVYQDGFYSYPCAPVTRPGGAETWRLDFTNSGNANARVIATVDTLPAVGDQNVIVPGGRGSQFAVSLIGKVQANLDPGATLTAYYSTQVLSQDCNENAIEVYTNLATPDPSCNYGWTPFDASTPESALTGARTVEFVVTYPEGPSGQGLQPGDTLSIQFDTRTPSVLPKESAVASGTPVAYNSFAGASRTVATASQAEHGELPAEPQRVAVATATGQLQMVKVVHAPDFSGDIDLPSSYPMLVSCTSNDDPITLVHADGSDASRPSIPSDGSVFVYDNTTGPVNLSLFADCTVVEDPKIPGDTSMVNPDTPLVADRDLSTNDQVYNPYIGTPDKSRWTITNTFTAGGFTVSKAVDNGGAVDQNGTPIVYDQVFSFTASCTYLGQEALALTDRVFTLHDGESKHFTGIPTGADCTVTETDDGGAGSTDVTLTTGGDTSTTTGSSTEFTVGDGDATITTAAFTNHMTVGSVAIDKVITGAGSELYGNGPFTFHMVCTLAGANPDTVYDDTFTLTPPDDLTKTVDNLPTGASCDVTETVKGGAQVTTIDPNPVTVGDGDTQHVTATNEFQTGGLNVHKDIEGPGAAIWGQGPFQVSLNCSYNGSAVTIPGGDARTLALVSNWNASYDPLPIGSECYLVETDNGGATQPPTITDANGDPVDATHPVTITSQDTPLQLTVTNTFDVGRIQVDKIVTGGSANLHTGDTFEVTAACTYEGKTIVVPGGAVRQLTVDTPVVYEDLPVGADCTISETNNSGANDVRIAPSHVTVGDDTTAHVVVDNVYTVGGFTVTKRVLSNAQNQDGDPIVYDEKFTFHASCTYNGQEMITSDATFRIADDESKSFEDLPTGSNCTVTEIGDGGAASTTVLVTGQGSPGGSLSNGVDFPIGTGDSSITTVRFTNRMPVGSLQVQKVVDGAGAKLWGAGPFTMHVECVLVGADPNVVYDGDVVLGGANPLTATISDLPTGAECHVGETDAAGAQASAIDPKLVKIGDDTTVNVTVTNTFTVGQIVVSKKLAGSGASEHQNDTFHISLMCVWNGVQVPIPGGDERALTVATPVTYSGLPVGADCTVTETDANGAVGVSMTPASPDNPQTASVVIGDGTTVTVVVTNVFDPSAPVLPVTGGDATIWLIAGGIGLLLIGGGAVLLITRRRRRV